MAYPTYTTTGDKTLNMPNWWNPGMSVQFRPGAPEQRPGWRRPGIVNPENRIPSMVPTPPPAAGGDPNAALPTPPTSAPTTPTTPTAPTGPSGPSFPSINFNNNNTGVTTPWNMSQRALSNLRVPGPQQFPGATSAVQNEVTQNLGPIVNDMRENLRTQSQLTAAGLDADMNQQMGRMQLNDLQNMIAAYSPYNMFQANMAVLPLRMGSQLMGSMLGNILGNVGGFVGNVNPLNNILGGVNPLNNVLG